MKKALFAIQAFSTSFYFSKSELFKISRETRTNEKHIFKKYECTNLRI